MRARFAWLGAVAVAGVAAYRKIRRLPAPAEDPRAVELRRKLDESRTLVDEHEREEFESAETTVDAAEPEPVEVEDRRGAVHERGRAAAEKMRGRSAE